MQAVSAILTIIYIAMLNCSLNKIFDDFQIIENIRENHEILSGNQGKVMEF